MASSSPPRSDLPTWAQELCQNIESNDASLTKVAVVGMDNHTALALAQALSNNTIVTDVDLDLSFVHAHGIAALGDMLALNTFIHTVRIETCFNDNIHHPCAESREYQHSCSRAAIARGLVRNTNVTKLVLEGYGLDDGFWQCLSQNQHLQEVYISRAQLPPSFAQHYLTQAQHSLQKLVISNSIVYMGDDTDFVNSGLLEYALDASTQRKVQLSSVRVQHGEPQYSDSPRRLLPRFINIGRFRYDVLFIERGFTSDCAVALATKLKCSNTTTRLNRLYLPENPLGSVGVVALSDMLQHNSTLQMLDIRNIFIDDSQRATRALGKALCNNKSLMELRVGKNCGVNFSRDIAAALQVNTSLKKLDLSFSNVGNDGATELAKALETNETLRVLKLNQCRIGAVGAAAMARALLQNDSLKELHLSDNTPLCETSSQVLLNAVKENYTLEKLTLDTAATRPSFQRELDYWLRLTPCGRAMLRQNVIPSLIPRVLHRVSKDGGVNALFAVLSERPDLVMR